MPRAYSVDLRERSLRAVASGRTMTEVAALFGVGRSSLARWHRRQIVGQSLTPGRSSGRPRVITTEQEADLRAQVLAAPDATLAMHQAQWEATHGVRVGSATMSRTLRRLGLPLKRKR